MDGSEPDMLESLVSNQLVSRLYVLLQVATRCLLHHPLQAPVVQVVVAHHHHPQAPVVPAAVAHHHRLHLLPPRKYKLIFISF